MKKLLVLPLFLLSINLLLAQEYINKIAEDVCDCLSKMDDSASKTEMESQLGICMINSAMPYKKKIKKDFDIDLDNPTASDGQTLGKVIGVRLAGQCPGDVMKMYSKMHEGDNPPPPMDQASAKITEPSETVSGVVTKIEDGNFIVFSLKDDKGKVIKLYWMDFISSDIDLSTDYSVLLNKSVEVSYTRHDYFDPKIKEYRQHNVITAIKLN